MSDKKIIEVEKKIIEVPIELFGKQFMVPIEVETEKYLLDLAKSYKDSTTTVEAIKGRIKAMAEPGWGKQIAIVCLLNEAASKIDLDENKRNLELFRDCRDNYDCDSISGEIKRLEHLVLAVENLKHV